MAIYRGSGGATDTTDQATIDEVTEQAGAAAASATAAASSASSASTSASNASTSASQAATSATSASTSASQATSSKNAAASSATAAEAAKVEAEAAQAAAENAEANAITYGTNAVSSASEAATSATAAQTARDVTQGYRDDVIAYDSSASDSASAAASSATAAASSATAASDSADEAAASATAAQAALDAMEGVYIGASATTPTADGNGDDLTIGDWYYNTTDNQAYIYNGSTWDALAPDLVGDATPQLGGNLSTNGNDINFGDNDKATFGAGSDLQIYHDGFHSYIDDAGTGALRIRGDEVQLGKYTGEKLLAAYADAQVDLYYNNSVKLATTSTGVDVTGDIKLNGSTALSYSGGITKLSGAGTWIDIGDSNESTVRILADGAGGSTLTATSTGIDVTGTATMDGLTVDSTFVVDNATGGTTPFVKAYRASVSADRPILQTENASTGGITSRFDGNGDISFYEDTGTTAKFFWDASAESLGIGTSSPSGVLHTYKNSTNAYNLFQGNAGSWVFGQADGKCQVGGLLGTHSGITVDTSGNVGIGTSSPSQKLQVAGGSIQLDTNTAVAFGDINTRLQGAVDGTYIFYGNATERMRITSSGNVGIGTSSPSSALDVQGTITIASGQKIRSTSSSGYIRISGGATYSGGSIELNGGNGDNNIEFYTDNGSQVQTERMRITSTGDLLVGKTTNDSNVEGAVLYADSSTGASASFTSDGIRPLLLNRKTSDGDIVEFRKDGTTVGSIGSNTTAGNPLLDINSQSHMRFVVNGDTSATEAMRLDDSGNLLVGKTTTGIGSVGLGLLPNGLIQATRSNNPVTDFNRLSSDGVIIELSKDGTTVGSIGTDSNSELYISGANNRGGLGFYDSATGAAIQPVNSDGTASNGDTSLGIDTNRFKDLYLSGGVYLGGTGASNHLQDYEEGTWTVSFYDAAAAGVASPTTTTGYYTKIGDTVSISFTVSNIDTTGMNTANRLYIRGLPFSSESGSGGVASGSCDLRSVTFSGVPSPKMDGGSSVIFFLDMQSATSFADLKVSAFQDDAADISISMVYRTA